MTYKMTSGSSVVREADGAFIPNDLANIDWQAYQEWVESGNTPLPADVSPPTPATQAFVDGVKAAMGGIVAANALAKAYPLFYPAVASGEFADVQALILDAHTSGALTGAQYSGIKALAAQNNIPVALP